MLLSTEIHPHSPQYLYHSPNKLGLPLISAERLENKIHSCHTRHLRHSFFFIFLNTQSSLPDACSLWFHCKESQHKERITSVYTFSHGNATGNDSSSTMSLIMLKGSYCFLGFRQDVPLHDVLCQDA